MTIDDDLDYEQYGPQAHHLAVLLGRCVTLTPREIEDLAGDWHPTLRDRDSWGDDDRSLSG